MPVTYSDVQTVLHATPKVEAPKGPADEAK
jgi:hypothetical protein